MADRKIFANQGPHDPNLKKSMFDWSYRNNLTARFGRLTPVCCLEVPAASSLKIKTNFAFDVDPLVFPIQSSVRCHVSLYKIPMRILWKNFRNFYGQVGSDGQINGQNSYTMPYISRSAWTGTGSLADYMGIPSTKVVEENSSVSIALQQERLTGTGDTFVYHAAIPANTTIRHDLDNGTFTLSVINKVSTAYNGQTYVRFNKVMIRENVSPHEVAWLYDYNVPTIFGGDVRLVLVGDTIETKSYGDVVYYKHILRFRFDGSVTPITEFIRVFNEEMRGSKIELSFYSSTPLFFSSSPTGFVDGVIAHSPNSGKTISAATLVTSQPQNYGVVSASVNCVQSIISTASHFDSDGVTPPAIPINALPFRAYEFCYRYFFENKRVTPFIKDGKPVYDEYLTNDGDGADATTPVDFFNAPYEYDMFTTCVPTPFFGNAPLVGVTSNSDASTATFHMQDTSSGDTYDMEVRTNERDEITGISYVPDTAKTETIEALQQAISLGISIADFRNCNALTKFLEKHMQAGTKYQNIVFQFFGTNPPVGEEYPVYLGGCTRDIKVGKITNVAQSENNPLGDFAGAASLNGSSKPIRVFCSEPCYVLGLMWFSVTPVYAQMLPAHFTKSKLLDYYNPLFANISAQPVMKRNLCPLQLDTSEINDVFGYNRPYVDYCSKQDEVHGEFRDSRSDFLLQRLFAHAPALSKRFLEIHSEDLTDVFAFRGDSDKFFGQIAFDISAKLPLPKFSIPQII